MKFDVRAIFYYSSLISKSISRKDRNLWSRDRLCTALSKDREDLQLSRLRVFGPQTAARLANYKTIDGYRGLHYSYWLYRRFACVEYTSNYGVSVVWNVVLNEIICHLSRGKLGRLCVKLG